MSIQLQFRRGNTAQTAVFTGAVAELTVDTDKNTVILHDGVTAGGYALARESSLSANQALAQNAFNKANAAYDAANTKYNSSGGTISGDVVVTGNVTPTTDNVYSLGSASYRWKDIFVGAGTVDIDGVKLSKVNNQLVVTGATDLILSGTNLPSSLNTANNIANAFNQANLAYDAANTAYTAGGARAFDQANLAFDKANSAWDYANSAYATANNEIVTRQANVGAAVISITGAYEANVGAAKIIVLGRADSAFAQANLAFDAANNVAPQIQPTRDVANSAFAQANLAYDTANVGVGIATSGFAQANLAYDKANSAWDHANSAYDLANTKFSSSGGTISGSVTVTGNLTVGGGVTSVTATNLAVSDNMLYLNQAIQTTITNAVGDGANVVYTTSQTHNYQVGMFVTVTGIDPSGYNTSNSTITAVSSNSFNVASAFTGSYVSGGTARARAVTNPDLGFAAGYNDGTYHHAGLFRDASDGIWKFFYNYAPEPDASPYIDTSNSTFRIADLTANLITDVITLRGVDPLDYANTIQTNAQANVGAGLIIVTEAYQANVGAARIADRITTEANLSSAIAQGQANVGAGLITVTSAYQANVGAGLITKVAKAGDIMTGTLSTSGSLIGSSITSNTNVSINTNADIVTTSVTTGSTSEFTLNAFSTSAFRSAKYLVQIESGGAFHMIELSLIHNGTTVYLSQYGEVKSGISLASFDASISGGFLSLLSTPTNPTTTYKLIRTALTV